MEMYVARIDKKTITAIQSERSANQGRDSLGNMLKSLPFMKK